MDKPLTHADGATDIDCGPSAPGAGKNGLKTLPDPGFFVMLRLSGPTQPFFDQTWKPSALEKVP